MSLAPLIPAGLATLMRAVGGVSAAIEIRVTAARTARIAA